MYQTTKINLLERYAAISRIRKQSRFIISALLYTSGLDEFPILKTFAIDSALVLAKSDFLVCNSYPIAAYRKLNMIT